MYELEMMEGMVNLRQSRIMAEALRDRLLKELQAERIGLAQRFLAGLGDLLISLGRRLQERYAPIANHAAGA